MSINIHKLNTQYACNITQLTFVINVLSVSSSSARAANCIQNLSFFFMLYSSHLRYLLAFAIDL